MVVYNVFSSCIHYQYKAYICSKATVVLVVLSTLTVLFPIIFTYKSPGFWLKTDTYQEQPKVNFLYDYIIFFDILKPYGKKLPENVPAFMCSSIQSVLYSSKNFNYCPFIKAYEEDINRDGFNDLLKFETKLLIPPNSGVTDISILLLFDYKLSSYCRAQLEGAAYVHLSSAVPRAGVKVVGDLVLAQHQPLSPRRYDTRYNASVVPRDSGAPVLMGDVLEQYALRNLSTRLTNLYTTWMSGRADEEPFTVNVTITYPEVTIRYTPTTWQELRAGWTQFFPVLIVFVYIFRRIKDFIFGNQLVTTYREAPWSKGY